MAQPDNPLVPVQEKVLRIESRLLEFLRNVLVKIRPIMQSLAKFLAEIRKAAKELAKTVGKAAISSILKAGAKLISLVSFVEKQTVEGIKMARKIIGVIRKAIEPTKVFKVVKAMVGRLARVFRIVLTKVVEVMMILNPIDMVLGVINTMRMVLQLIFKWINQTGGVSNGVKKAKTLVKKSIKILKQEAKQVTQLVKEVNKLKPA